MEAARKLLTLTIDHDQVDFGAVSSSAVPPSSAELAASRSLNLTMPSYSILPNEETQYVCSNFKLPTDQKYHIIQYEVSGMNVVLLSHIRGWCGFPLLYPLPHRPSSHSMHLWYGLSLTCPLTAGPHHLPPRPSSPPQRYIT